MNVSRRQILKLGAVVVAGLVLDPTAVFAQEREGHESMGPFSPWTKPKNLGEVVNSTSNEYHPAISNDGRSLYISSDRAGSFGNNDIWVSQRANLDAPWGRPMHLGPNINTPFNEFAPAFSSDGHWLFFSRATSAGSNDPAIWSSYRRDIDDDFAWEKAVKLAGEINQPDFDQNAPTFFHDEETGITTIYFNSFKRPDGLLAGLGDYDIYASTRRADGAFGPGVLVKELCSKKRDTRTAIRRDGLEMIIGSNRDGGGGQIDLWASTRATTLDLWSTPVNLGDTVNSGADDGGPALSADGTALYFYSTRTGGFGGRDLYVTTRTRLVGEHAS
jgi:Tol biopolymer transport system component